MKLTPDKGSLEWVMFSEPLKQLIRRGGPGGASSGGGYSSAQIAAIVGTVLADVPFWYRGISNGSWPYAIPDDDNRSVALVVQPATVSPGDVITLPHLQGDGIEGRSVVVHVPSAFTTSGATLDFAAASGESLVGATQITSGPATRVFIAMPGSPAAWYEVLASGGTAAATSYTYARALCLDNMDLSGTETQDGVNLAAGEYALCINQTTAHENGLWVVAAGAWTRPTGWAPQPNDTIRVREGTGFSDTLWQLTNNTAPSLGSDSQTWRRIDARIATLHGTDANAAPKNNLGRIRVSFPNLTANRFITLPAATGNDGQEVWVQIEANVAAGRTVTATVASGLINGNAVITGPWAAGLFIARNGNWNRM